MEHAITIANWRPKQIEAVLTNGSERCSVLGYVGVGEIRLHLIANGERFRTIALGPILRDSSGNLWVKFPDTVEPVDSSRLAFLASSVENLEAIAKRNVHMANSAMLPRSRQHEYAAASKTYDAWLSENDPICALDEGSFWNRLHGGDV